MVFINSYVELPEDTRGYHWGSASLDQPAWLSRPQPGTLGTQYDSPRPVTRQENKYEASRKLAVFLTWFHMSVLWPSLIIIVVQYLPYFPFTISFTVVHTLRPSISSFNIPSQSRISNRTQQNDYVKLGCSPMPQKVSTSCSPNAIAMFHHLLEY